MGGGSDPSDGEPAPTPHHDGGDGVDSDAEVSGAARRSVGELLDDGEAQVAEGGDVSESDDHAGPRKEEVPPIERWKELLSSEAVRGADTGHTPKGDDGTKTAWRDILTEQEDAWRAYCRDTAAAHGVDVAGVHSAGSEAHEAAASVDGPDGECEYAERYWSLLRQQIPAEPRIIRDVRRTFAAFSPPEDAASAMPSEAGPAGDGEVTTAEDAGGGEVGGNGRTRQDSVISAFDSPPAPGSRAAVARAAVLKADSLRRVLCALSVHDPYMGYCQGMNFIAGLALEVLRDEVDAFWLCVRLLSARFVGLRGLYMDNVPMLADALSNFEEYASHHVPEVIEYLGKNCFSPALYCVEWFTTLFAVNLPMAASRCVVSMILDGVDNVLMRVGTAALMSLRVKLLTMSAEHLMRDFKPTVRRLPVRDLLLLSLCLPAREEVLSRPPMTDADRERTSASAKAVRHQSLSSAGGAATRATGGAGGGSRAESGSPAQLMRHASSPSDARAQLPGSAAARQLSLMGMAASGGGHGAHPDEHLQRAARMGVDDASALLEVDLRNITAETMAQVKRRASGLFEDDWSEDSSDSDGAGSTTSDESDAVRAVRSPHRERSMSELAREREAAEIARSFAPRVAVTEAVDMGDHHAFVISVSMGTRTWLRVRRFRAFWKLHKDLEEAHPDVALPPVPPKAWFNTNSTEFLRSRRAALHAYLRNLTMWRGLEGSVTLWEFLAPVTSDEDMDEDERAAPPGDSLGSDSSGDTSGSRSDSAARDARLYEARGSDAEARSPLVSVVPATHPDLVAPQSSDDRRKTVVILDALEKSGLLV